MWFSTGYWIHLSTRMKKVLSKLYCKKLLLDVWQGPEYASIYVKSNHCVKYRHCTKFPGVEILWQGTVFAYFQVIWIKLCRNCDLDTVHLENHQLSPIFVDSYLYIFFSVQAMGFQLLLGWYLSDLRIVLFLTNPVFSKILDDNWHIFGIYYAIRECDCTRHFLLCSVEHVIL